MHTPFLEIKELSHVFSNGKEALKNINLSINRGEFIVLAGPNGSGKTVLMRHLNGLAKPSSGQVLLENEPIEKDLRQTRRTIGLVFQDADSQIVGQTVYRDACFGPENLKLPRKEIDNRVKEALAASGLTGFEDRRPHTLSGGEKRRLAAAGVIAMQPQMLVLDEPFTALDWPGSSKLLKTLVNLHKKGTGILLITHDLEKVLAHAQRLIIMNNGRIQADGPPAEVINNVEQFGIRRPACSINEMSWLIKEETL